MASVYECGFMKYVAIGVAALIFSFIYTPVDNRMRRRGMKPWLRYMWAFVIGIPILTVLQLLMYWLFERFGWL